MARNLGSGIAVQQGSMTGRLDCAEVERRLWEYLDGALPMEEAAAVRTHLFGCSGCGPMCQCCRALLLRVARTPACSGTAPDSLRERILALLVRQP
jgi:anti-sigma factor (TIGR02949 family)